MNKNILEIKSNPTDKSACKIPVSLFPEEKYYKWFACLLLKNLSQTWREDKHLPFFRLSLRLRCLLTKQAARVLKRMAAARKQMVATIPANTGRASPSSVRSGCGKMSARKARSTHGSLACQSFPHLF